MKKILAFVVLLLLTSCAVTGSVAVNDQPICRQDPNCTNYGIHDHVFFTW